MSTAEVQIKIGTIADLSGIRKTEASLTGLQSELQKKLSAKGIGMSLLEGLGIGSGFRLADTIAEALVKPFKEAAEFADAMAESTDYALKKMRETIALRNEGNVAAQRAALEAQVRDAAAAEATAKAANIYKFTQYDGSTDTEIVHEEVRQYTKEQTENFKNASKAYADATAALDRFNLAQQKLDDNRRDNATKSAGDEQTKVAEAVDRRAEAIKREADAVRNSLTPLAEHKKKMDEIYFLANTFDSNGNPFLSAADTAAAIAKLNAEFNRPEQIRQSALALEVYKNAIADIEQNPLLTDKEKREAMRTKLAEENEEIKRQIKLWQDLNAVAPNADNQARIDALNQQMRDNNGKGRDPASKLDQANMGARNLGDSSQHYQSAGDGAQGGLIEALTEFGTMADQIADTIKNTIGGAVQSVGTHMTGWIMRTESFGKALRNIGTSVLSAFINQIIQMGVQWLITQGLIKMGLITTHATGEALKAASTASTISQETMKTPVLATNAGLASVSSFGVAAILGIALLIAGIAALAFESGGMIPGGEKLIRVNEAGQESVLNARATSTLGSAFVNAVNSGDFAAAHQMMSPLGGITRPGFSPEMQEGGEGRAEAAQAGAMNIAVRGFNAQHEIAQWMDSREGRKMIVNLIDGRVSHHS